MVRTYRDALESRYEMKLGGKHNVVPWLVKHAAATQSRFLIGNDCRSALQRLKGKRCRRDRRGVGECSMYLKPGYIREEQL